MRAARLWPPLDVNTVGAGYTYPPLEYLTPWVPNPRDTYLLNTYFPWIPTPWDTYPPIHTPQNDRRLWKKLPFSHTLLRAVISVARAQGLDQHLIVLNIKPRNNLLL